MDFKRTANSTAVIDGKDVDRHNLLLLDAMRTAEEPKAGIQLSMAVRNVLADVKVYQRLDQMKASGWIQEETNRVVIKGHTLNKKTWDLVPALREAMTTENNQRQEKP